jgi:hypothetical protein
MIDIIKTIKFSRLSVEEKEFIKYSKKYLITKKMKNL